LFPFEESAAESFGLLSETYGDCAPSISICEYWFKQFQSGDFNLEDNKRSTLAN